MPIQLRDTLTGEEVRRHDARLRALMLDPGYVGRLRRSDAMNEGFSNPYVFLASDLDDHPEVSVR